MQGFRLQHSELFRLWVEDVVKCPEATRTLHPSNDWVLVKGFIF